MQGQEKSQKTPEDHRDRMVDSAVSSLGWHETTHTRPSTQTQTGHPQTPDTYTGTDPGPPSSPPEED